MEMLDSLWLGLTVAVTPTNLLWCLIGVFLGTAIGVLPGLGPSATIAMLLPATIERWFTPGFRAAALDKVKAIADGFVAINRDGYAAACEAIGRMDLRPILKDIATPNTVIAGAEDPATPPVMAEALREGIADAELVVLSPAAHLLAVERPARVAGELRRSIALHTAGER